jgi:methionyl-tRNA formyltransferase
MMPLSVFLTGQKAFGQHVAEAVIAAGHTITACASPAWTGPYAGLAYPFGAAADDARPDRLYGWCERTGTPWVDAVTITADKVPAVDVIVAAHSHAFVGRKTRARARLAAVGYHPSLLPLHRGRDAVRWTIRDGDRVTGGSVYHLTDNIDAGPLAAQDFVFVPPGSTADTLWRDHLAPLGVALIVKTLADLANGRVVTVPQDERYATWEPSWERPRLFRPELPELLSAAPAAGVEYVADRGALR